MDQLTGLRGLAVILVISKWFPIYDETAFLLSAHWEDVALVFFFLLSALGQKNKKLENWENGNWQHHKFTTHEKRWTRERERERIK